MGIKDVEVLYDKDIDFILQMLYRLYAIDEVEEFQRVCLEQLRVIIPCSRALFCQERRESGTAVILSAVSISENGVDNDFVPFSEKVRPHSFNEDYFRPWCVAFRHSDYGKNYFSEDSRIYQDVYKALNIHHTLKIILVYNDLLLGDINLYRTKDSADFSDRDLRIANLIKENLALILSKLVTQTVKKSSPLSLKSQSFNFTKREAQVLELIRQGISDAEICDRLDISLSTLKKYIHQLYIKTNANNRIHLLRITGD